MNTVFIATSLDGYIADREGGLSWLETVPNPTGDDMGYGDFMNRTDALIMGRKTFETVLGFGIDWPYPKPVYVLSSTRKDVPPKLAGKVFLRNGPLKDVLQQIHKEGHQNLYIDGGTTIQQFLREGLIDELIITTIPVLLGGGARLFGELNALVELELIDSKVLLDQVVQRHYRVVQGARKT